MNSGPAIQSMLERSAAEYGEKPAFIQDGSRITYRIFLKMVKNASVCLKTAGLIPGSRVAFRLSNNAEDIATALGIILAGGCLIPIPPGSAAMEKQAYIRECLATHDLTAGAGVVRIKENQERSGPEALSRAVIIRPTSGTTGRRKGVILSSDSITGRIYAANQVLETGPEDMVLWTLPCAFHLVVSILLYLASGATVILAENQYPDTLLDLAEKYPVTLLYGTPRQYRMLASDPSGRRFSDLRRAISTGTFLPADVAESFEQRFCHPLRQAYGIIEAGLVAINSSNPPGPSISVGQAVPGYEIKIQNGNGRDLPDGSQGNIVIRGPGMFEGYVHGGDGHDPDSWFASGDTGIMEKGVLVIRGRSHSVIHVAGMKVFPEEVEACLMTHPSVEAVRVYGTVHARSGEVIRADIRLKSSGAEATENALYLHCRKHLSPWKVPAVFNMGAEIQETLSGKVKRQCFHEKHGIYASKA